MPAPTPRSWKACRAAPPGVDGFVFTSGRRRLRHSHDDRGLAADAAGTMTLHPETSVQPGPCIMIAIGRQLLIRTDSPVEPDAIVVR